MAIKLIFALIAFFAVSFLSRFLVALLKESALAVRSKAPKPVVVRSYTDSKVQTRKLSRLRVAEQNEIRLIPMS